MAGLCAPLSTLRRIPTHDSGAVWFARPSLRDLHSLLLAGLPGAPEFKTFGKSKARCSVQTPLLADGKHLCHAHIRAATALLIEPDIFETPAIVDAIHHD